MSGPKNFDEDYEDDIIDPEWDDVDWFEEDYYYRKEEDY